MPAIIEHGPQAGALATLTVANRSAAPLAVTVTPRPWTQSGSGKVSPNRRATLPGVSVSQSTFTLAPGAEQQVSATLNSAPSAGYLYGALEVVGVPTDAATRKGVVLGYRLVGSLRILPTAPKYGLTASNAEGRQRHRRDPGQEHRQHARRGQRDGQRQGRARDEEPRDRGRADPARQDGQRAGRQQARQPARTRPRSRSPSAARRHSPSPRSSASNECPRVTSDSASGRLRSTRFGWSPDHGLGGALRYRCARVGAVGGQDENPGREVMKLRTILAGTVLAALVAPAACGADASGSDQRGHQRRRQRAELPRTDPRAAHQGLRGVLEDEVVRDVLRRARSPRPTRRRCSRSPTATRRAVPSSVTSRSAPSACRRRWRRPSARRPSSRWTARSIRC